MLKTLLKQIKQYRKASVLAAVFTVLEVILELIIPMLMAAVIDHGIESGNINNVYFYGLQNSHHPLLEVYAHDFRNNKSQKKTPAASDRCSTINYLFFIKTNTEFLNPNSPNWNLPL
mgnify:CR=1 FL=1